MSERAYLSPRESAELWRWARDEWAALERRHGLDPDPPRCWSCGHPFGAGCECSCCYDDDPHGEWNPDA